VAATRLCGARVVRFGGSKNLRTHADMPIEDTQPGEWNSDVALREVIEKIDVKRADSEKRVAATAQPAAATSSQSVTSFASRVPLSAGEITGDAIHRNARAQTGPIGTGLGWTASADLTKPNRPHCELPKAVANATI
jgi:hypothetical protein